MYDGCADRILVGSAEGLEGNYGGEKIGLEPARRRPGTYIKVLKMQTEERKNHLPPRAVGLLVIKNLFQSWAKAPRGFERSARGVDAVVYGPIWFLRDRDWSHSRRHRRINLLGVLSRRMKHVGQPEAKARGSVFFALARTGGKDRRPSNILPALFPAAGKRAPNISKHHPTTRRPPPRARARCTLIVSFWPVVKLTATLFLLDFPRYHARRHARRRGPRCGRRRGRRVRSPDNRKRPPLWQQKLPVAPKL